MLSPSQSAPRQNSPAIGSDHGTVQMRRRPARHEHDQAGNILCVADPQVRRTLGQLVRAALQLHQTVGHLGGIETGSDGVAEDMPWAELDGQILGEMDDGRLGGRVSVRGVGTQRADADAGHRRRHDDTRRGLNARIRPEQGLELLDRVEDALDVQVHDLLEGGVRVGLEPLAPRGPRVGEEDVDMRRAFAHLAG